MKSMIQIILMTLAVIAVSCKKDSVPINGTSNNPIVGEWAVSSFVDNSINKTSEFAAYSFAFGSNNSLQVKGGTMMNMCNWTFTDSVYHFNMMGMHSNALDDMNGDWRLMNYSDTTCIFNSTLSNDRTFILKRL